MISFTLTAKHKLFRKNICRKLYKTSKNKNPRKHCYEKLKPKQMEAISCS